MVATELYEHTYVQQVEPNFIMLKLFGFNDSLILDGLQALICY